MGMSFGVLKTVRMRLLALPSIPVVEKIKGQPLEFALAKGLSPSVGFHFFLAQHPKGKIVVLQIPAADRVPIKYEDIPYIRIGAATPKLSEFPDREAQLLAKLRSFVWELGVAREYVTDEEVIALLSSDTYDHVVHDEECEVGHSVNQKHERPFVYRCHL